MAEALLDVDTFFHELTEDQRARLLFWAGKEGVPIDRTFAVLFGEGRVTVFAYDEPLRLNPEGTNAVEREPEIFKVTTPLPMDVLRLLVTREATDG